MQNKFMQNRGSEEIRKSDRKKKNHQTKPNHKKMVITTSPKKGEVKIRGVLLWLLCGIVFPDNMSTKQLG